MPFAVARRAGVLYLTLDTPGSAINIFNHASASQLIDLLAEVTPQNTRAIVFESAKPHSFINGVGLLLAHASQSVDDIYRASGTPWAAYRAVHRAPVPTIAIIQGSCFGCGVEFALNCDFRLASDSGETDFYMTELNDYLFIPLFGSTWNLPAAVGLEDAIDLLLWGQHWNAAMAYERGLVDAVARWDALATQRDALVERVLAGTQPSRRRGRVEWNVEAEGILERATRRVDALPPVYQAVYRDALRLLESGARQLDSYDEQQARELESSAASALSPIGKAAYAFFYLRQMASQRAGGRQRNPDETEVRLALRGARDCPLLDDIGTRKLVGVDLVEPDSATLTLVGGRYAHDLSGKEVGVCSTATAIRRHANEIYALAISAGRRFVELAIAPGNENSTSTSLDENSAARLARTLQRFGFEVARTRIADDFVSNRLLAAYFGPWLALAQQGFGVDRLNACLRFAGFVRRPADLIEDLGLEALATALGPGVGRAPEDLRSELARLAVHEVATDTAEEPRVLDALCVSLLHAVQCVRHRGEVGDIPTIDLIARELLDFPRHLCSLASWLKIRRVAAALANETALRPLVTEQALGAAEEFVRAGREFYR